MPPARKRPFTLRRLRIADLPPVWDAARTIGRVGDWLQESGVRSLKSECLAALILLVLLLSSCNARRAPQPAIAYAFAGPNNLNLRKDLGPRAPTVGTALHGERLEVLEVRRRFARVRTSSGTEGWTDTSNLLTQQQMGGLDTLANSSAKLPSQGKATVYDALNIHADSNRSSPSIAQIGEGSTVDVLAHRVTMHGAPPPAMKATSAPRPPSKKGKASAKEGPKPKDPPVAPPPLPPGPPLPDNWLALSVPRRSDLLSAAAAHPPAYNSDASARPTGDDWYLIRTKDGKAGWALTRMLVMLVPDEVAQYAEGHRIAGYLSLGEVKDKERGARTNWLWATSTGNLRPYDFDSFRVFVWSSKRHRYETAFIEKNVRGYYPLETVDLPDRDEKGFSLVVEEKDGMQYKRTYGFSGYHIRLISKTPYSSSTPLPDISSAHEFDTAPGPETAAPGWLDRVKRWWRGPDSRPAR